MNLSVRLTSGVGALKGPAWNALLCESQADHVFLRSEWLLAAAEVFGGEVVVVEVWRNEALIVAEAFLDEGRVWRFLGKGPSDYLDMLVPRHVSEAIAREATSRIVSAAFDAGAHHVL